jgi:hypothetical protein
LVDLSAELHRKDTEINRPESALFYVFLSVGDRAARDAVSSWAGLPAAIGEVCSVRD